MAAMAALDPAFQFAKKKMAARKKELNNADFQFQIRASETLITSTKVWCGRLQYNEQLTKFVSRSRPNTIGRHSVHAQNHDHEFVRLPSMVLGRKYLF